MESFLTPYDLSKCGQQKLRFTPFGVGPGEADETALVQELSKAISFFVLGPILVKLHIRTRLIESFPMIYSFWKVYGWRRFAEGYEIKMSIPLGAHD